MNVYNATCSALYTSHVVFVFCKISTCFSDNSTQYSMEASFCFKAAMIHEMDKFHKSQFLTLKYMPNISEIGAQTNSLKLVF